MTDTASQHLVANPVVSLGQIEFFRRGNTISVHNRLLPVTDKDRDEIADSLHALADMVSPAVDAKERVNLRKSALGWKWEAQRALNEYRDVRHELAELRAALAGDLWHWQGDGHDHLESLTGSVVISAADLAAIIHGRESKECPTQEDWRVVVVSGSDSTVDDDSENETDLFYSLFGTQDRATKIYSHLTKLGVDCWIESPSREKSTPPVV